MKTFAVNVGLAIPGSDLQMQPEPVIALLRAHFAVVDHAVVQSDTEQTVSAVLASYTGNEAEILRRVNLIAVALGQEAIAVWMGWFGELVGPQAREWGEFNPEFFLTTGGARLSDILRELP